MNRIMKYVTIAMTTVGGIELVGHVMPIMTFYDFLWWYASIC